MRALERSMNFLWSFSKLLRHLSRHGAVPMEQVAERTGFDLRYLRNLVERRQIADELVARHILKTGFRMEEPDVDQLILGIQLFDLGLRDNEFRQLVIDLIRKTTPVPVREQLRRLYRSYAEGG
jgi:hypothetical protein